MHVIINVVVFDKQLKHILTCKDPVDKKIMPVAGDLIDDEILYDAAYRVIYESCGIPADEIILNPLCSLTDRHDGITTEAWYGILSDDYGIACGDNIPFWYDIQSDADMRYFDDDEKIKYIFYLAKKAVGIK